MEISQYNNKLVILAGLIILVVVGGLVFLLNSGSKINNFINLGGSSQVERGTVITGANTPGQKKKPNDFSFTASELPSFKLPSVAYASDLKNKTTIYDSEGKAVQASLSVNKNGSGSEIALQPTGGFVPGKYTLVVNENGNKISQDFTWGVLAINTNKSIYVPGETALLSLAVLDEKGTMVCNAEVTLKITDPSGNISTSSTDNGLIKVNHECYIKDMTTKPDYETAYKVDAPGTYQMELSAVTKNGTFQIQDSFEVQSSVDFDVERTTATRIFPFSTYPVLINITANKDFSGQIEEPVPTSFKITTLQNTTAYNSIQANGNTQSIIWNVSLKKGQSINIGYNYKAPEVSPQFYLLGPLSLVSGNTTLFQEKRQWQLAIDDVGYSSAVSATPGLVSYWRLGESSGTTATDSKGTNTGTYTGTITALGQPGAIQGDSNTSVQLSTTGVSTQGSVVASNITVPIHVTWEGWIKLSAWPADSTVIGEWDGTHGSMLYLVSPSGNHSITMWVQGASTADLIPGPSLNAWHYLVGTYDGTNARVYVDGQLAVGPTALTGPITSPAVALEMGAYNAGGGDRLQGYLDEVAYYNVVLTPAQILAHYNLGIGTTYETKILSTAGLISYWRLDESSGTSAADSFGTNTGTYRNSPTLGQTGAIVGDSDTAVKFARASSQDVTIPDSSTLRFTSGPASVEFWFKFTTSDGTNSVAFAQNVNGAILIEANGPAAGGWRFYSNGIAAGAVSSINITDTTTWHQFVGTVDVSNNYKIYIDGINETTTLATPAFGFAGTSNSTGIASDGAGPPGYEPFNGSIDEVSLYKVALTAAQVLDHYNTAEGIASTSIGDFLFQGVQLQGVRIN